MPDLNRFAGRCFYCRGHVPAKGGVLVPVAGRSARRPAHLACAKGQTPRVLTYYSPVTGHSWTVNANGRCEDAPCCGCCS